MTHAGIDRGHASERVIDRAATATPELSSYDRRTVGWRTESSSPSPHRVVEREPRVLIVSNRLPVTAVERDGELRLQPSSGGLASAVRGVHDRFDSVWIGSLGAVDLDEHEYRGLRQSLAGDRLVSIALSESERTGHYQCYSNGVLWPALHGIESPSRGYRGWKAYRAVNQRFANAIAAVYRRGDTVWVHDYQLMLVPRMLRERLPDARIGFFRHTPVPSRDHLESLEEWTELATGLSGADIIGVQTEADARRLAAALDVDERANRAGAVFGQVIGHPRVMAFPIAVDHAWFAARARHPEVLNRRAAFRAATAGPLFVGVDRLDYTKGIPERLLAFQQLLALEPAWHGAARFVQVAVPSRQDVAGYAETRRRVEAIVQEINGTFSTSNWTPVHYVHGSVDPYTLIALYRAADVMVVTPRRDGMNLVAKEFVASRIEGGGALVLSRGAGAAEELSDAVLVEPNNVSSALAGYQRAIQMSASERRTRMRRMRQTVCSRNVVRWATECLSALAPERRGMEDAAD